MAAAPARLTWQRTTVQGRPAVYGVAGEGRPLVFLHGWGLSHRSYRRALGELIGKGVRIYAPALPGFGGTARLPEEDLSLSGFARWVHDFVSEVGVGEGGHPHRPFLRGRCRRADRPRLPGHA